MDREVAKTLLGGKVAATSRPVLSNALLDALLDNVATTDSNGVAPGGTGYVPTWDLNAAASEGWRMKAGMVAGDFNFSADNASYSKADVLAHCLEMQTRYANLSHGLIQTLQGKGPLPVGWDGTLVP